MLGIQGFQVAGKAWVSLAGSLLTLLVPLLLQVSTSLPAPWPSLIGALVALLTAFGVYHAPYAPTGGQPVDPVPQPKKHGLP